MRWYVYRLFNVGNELLYVGSSKSALKRLAEHQGNQGWVDNVAKVTIERFDSKTLALKAELAAIKAERPQFNVAGVPRKCPRCGEVMT